MKITDAFPSNYLKAADLNSRALKLTIADCRLEEIADGEQKPVLYFQGARKGLVLNKTNALTLASAYGDETDDWRGKEVEIYPDKVSFQGRIVDAIRVRIPAAPAQAPEDDDIPF